MLVHLVKAIQHGAEVVRADGQHGRKADRRVHRVAAADPIPEAEHVGGIDAELRNLGCIGRNRDKVFGDGFLVTSQSGQTTRRGRYAALVMVSSVVKVFEETMNNVSADRDPRTASAKSVPSTLETKRKVMSRSAVMPERFVGHDRTEIGAADADIDDVANAFSSVALPFAAAHAVGEVGHLVEHGMNFGHDVLSVDQNRLHPSERAAPRAEPRASP